MPEQTEHPLGTVITNATARKVIYGLYVVAGVTLGATHAGYAATSLGTPEWLGVATAVVAFLSIPLGSLALVNTPKRPE